MRVSALPALTLAATFRESCVRRYMPKVVCTLDWMMRAAGKRAE